MSPDQSEGVFDALGWAGDIAKALAVLLYAGPVTERIIGLMPEQSEGMKPTTARSLQAGREFSHAHNEIRNGGKVLTFDKVMKLLRSYHAKFRTSCARWAESN